MLSDKQFGSMQLQTKTDIKCRTLFPFKVISDNIAHIDDDVIAIKQMAFEETKVRELCKNSCNAI